MVYTIPFENLDKHSLPLVGGKNASLGEMLKAEIQVPPGFAVTTDCYSKFMTEAGINARIFHLLSGLNVDDMSALDRASTEIADLIKKSRLSGEICGGIEDAYTGLCRACGLESLPVAVRSSATAEDLPTASFAGQQDTYLWVEGADKVIDRVQKCWASLFTPRAISYRVRNQFSHEKVLISVGVQKMVNSKAAGVMFTINPTDGDPSKILIEGNWGLGETVVSGSVNPDKFIVDKVVRETVEKTISAKHVECVYDPESGEVINADIDSDRQSKCCLEEREIKALVNMAKAIESHYGRAMDIEWAIDKDLPFPDNIFIVQARPETVWSQRKAKPILGKKSGYQLLMEQAMKRIKVKE